VLDAATLLFGASLFQPRIRENFLYSVSFSEFPFRSSSASLSGESLLLALEVYRGGTNFVRTGFGPFSVT
jgi:hypothetical protein